MPLNKAQEKALREQAEQWRLEAEGQYDQLIGVLEEVAKLCPKNWEEDQDWASFIAKHDPKRRIFVT